MYMYLYMHCILNTCTVKNNFLLGPNFYPPFGEYTALARDHLHIVDLLGISINLAVIDREDPW